MAADDDTTGPEAEGVEIDDADDKNKQRSQQNKAMNSMTDLVRPAEADGWGGAVGRGPEANCNKLLFP